MISHLPTLNMISKNQEKLFAILNNISGNEKNSIDDNVSGINYNRLPRYIFTGEEDTLTVKLPEELNKLINRFCRKYRINKKEVLIIAIVDFLKECGYSKEIEEMMDGPY